MLIYVRIVVCVMKVLYSCLLVVCNVVDGGVFVSVLIVCVFFCNVFWKFCDSVDMCVDRCVMCVCVCLWISVVDIEMLIEFVMLWNIVNSVDVLLLSCCGMVRYVSVVIGMNMKLIVSDCV